MSNELIMPIDIYTDGSSLKNPGVSSLAYIIKYYNFSKENEKPETEFVEGVQGFKLSTNNRMEIMAVIYGIKKFIELLENKTFNTNQINIYSDSKYVCDAINSNWITKWQSNNWITSSDTPVKNKDLWEQIILLINKLNDINIRLIVNHIPGHKGFEFNEKCDKLCQQAHTGENHISDEEYEKLSK